MDNIGLFGGTFDPVHNGHLSIARAFLGSGYIDHLWIILTPEPPHKQGRAITDYHLRMEMLETAFSDVDHIRISDVEQNLPRPSYTIRTIRHLKSKFPGKSFYLCIGGDSLVDFDTWYRYKDILEECNLLVAKRPGEDYSEVDSEILDHVNFVDHEPVDISASALRDNLKNERDMKKWLPSGVFDIIQKHSLFKS